MGAEEAHALGARLIVPLSADILVVGAGIAGASAAYELSRDRRVVLLETEAQPGYHSTGRSAALFSETYGPPQVRALSRASRAFFEAPPDGFAATPLLSPRGVLSIARADQAGRLEEERAGAGGYLLPLTADEALARVPVLNPAYVAAALLEPEAMDIDVHALHSGYLAGFRRRGGVLALSAEMGEAKRAGGVWRVATKGERYETPVLVDAAGAWGDLVAERAGLRPLGLAPKRRTAFVFDAPAGMDAARWPMVLDADEEFYFKPDAGRLLGSPADATPVEPQDVQPEEIDVATAAWRIEQATTVPIRAIGRRWAGLRSFLPDGTPAIGFDPEAPAFFWLIGQGGYGIQSAPAAGMLAAGLIRDGAVPPALSAHGVDAAALSPARLRG